MVVPGWLADRAEIRHVESRSATAGETVPWPLWVPPTVQQAVAATGIQAPWRHQIQAADHVRAGHSVAISTPTATGKTLAYLLPCLTWAAEAAQHADPSQVGFRRCAPTCLYLAPTKALAHDQLDKLAALDIAGWFPACLDGDSQATERRYAREFATFVLTNPDMVHRSVLPSAPGGVAS